MATGWDLATAMVKGSATGMGLARAMGLDWVRVMGSVTAMG